MATLESRLAILMPHELTFSPYLDAFTGGLRHSLNALKTPSVEPDWDFLCVDIDAMRTMVRRMNTSSVQTHAAGRAETIPSTDQLAQAVQELTRALDAFAKHDREDATARLEAALQLLTV